MFCYFYLFYFFICIIFNKTLQQETNQKNDEEMECMNEINEKEINENEA